MSNPTPTVKSAFACTVCLLMHDGDCPPMTPAIARAESMLKFWYGGAEHATTRRTIASYVGAALLATDEMAPVIAQAELPEYEDVWSDFDAVSRAGVLRTARALRTAILGESA